VSRPAEGLQPERTALAWQRTALAVAACALIVARTALTRGAWAGAALAGAALVLGAALLLASARGYRRVRRRPRAGPLVDPRLPAAAVGLLAVAVILTATA
jgi:uncharacterized membrane protein YidH (DUF202 family)